MEVKVYYQNTPLATYSGDTTEKIMDQIGEHLHSLLSQTGKQLGNAAGYILEDVYAESDPEKEDTAWLHILLQGSDELINYDATDDEHMEEIALKICGLSKEDLPERYYYELGKDIFDPFDKKWLDNPVVSVGILTCMLDQLVIDESRRTGKKYYDLPSQITDRKYPNLKTVDLKIYLAQLMFYFSQSRVKQMEKNKKIFQRIDELLAALAGKNISAADDANVILYYYKTKGYFEKFNKITALKKYREESGKTQSEVAQAVGISLRQYKRYESTDSALPCAKKAVIEKVAETVGVTVDDIIFRDLIVLA